MAKQNNPDPTPAKKDAQVAWHALNAERAMAQLRSSETGLSSDEVARRRQQRSLRQIRHMFHLSGPWASLPVSLIDCVVCQPKLSWHCRLSHQPPRNHCLSLSQPLSDICMGRVSDVTED